MQLTVRNDIAAELAEEAGLEVIMDRCPKLNLEDFQENYLGWE